MCKLFETADINLITANADSLFRLDQCCFTDAWSAERWHQILEKTERYRCFLIQVRGSHVGYALVSVVLDEAELVRFCVTNEYRNRRIGRRALLLVTKKLEQLGIIKLMLELRASNIAAQKVYFASGFRVDGERVDYYHGDLSSERETAILMSKYLSDSQGKEA